MTTPNPATPNLVEPIRQSLHARIERLLRRPIIARVPEPASQPEPDTPHDETDTRGGAFRVLADHAAEHQPERAGDDAAAIWREVSPDQGTVAIAVDFDYDGVDRGREKEILDAIKNTIDSEVVLLTDKQASLLRTSPRAFLGLENKPEAVHLIGFCKEGTSVAPRVVELKLARRPLNTANIRHIAIVPNLVQLERQLEALQQIEASDINGPLAPLRAIVGLPAELVGEGDSSATGSVLQVSPGECLDEFQHACVSKAVDSPHFAVIHGPPGSGKTTVIGSIIRRLVDDGQRVLLVSPTHVAVDNVVEKLTNVTDEDDDLHPATTPVRYASNPCRVDEHAARYWCGKTHEQRSNTIRQRIQQRLRNRLPDATIWFDQLDPDDDTTGPLSDAIAEHEAVICGTPIGILSYEDVRDADPASFDMLIIDEVSKMTVPEFLAIAVKARRWVLVGDPKQLPPYNDAEEGAATLEDVLPPALELVCTAGAMFERAKPQERERMHMVVVTDEPDAIARAIAAHAKGVGLNQLPGIGVLDDERDNGVVVCAPEEIHMALDTFDGDARVLVQRGLETSSIIQDDRLVAERQRAGARLFETIFSVYHAQPWAKQIGQKLLCVRFRKSMGKFLPSQRAIDTLGLDLDVDRVTQSIAGRFLVNAVSMYDLVLGLPDAAHFDVSPMEELRSYYPVELCERIAPFVGTLKKQYRMHSSLSWLPRKLFYFGEALQDAVGGDGNECRVRLVQVSRPDGESRESNTAEAEQVANLLDRLADDPVSGTPVSIMVLTPYREQEALLREHIEHLNVDTHGMCIRVSTLDRCQGREADYVLLSLVRDDSTVFLDNPKRWNVALTRAKQGLFIVGDIDAYLHDAKQRRAEANRRGEPAMMSLLSRILEGYDTQIAG